MIIILVRTLIIYLLVLFVIRIMGKSELSAMEPFQLIVTLMIADLAVLPLESSNVSLFNGICALIGLLFIQMLVSFLTLKSNIIRRIVCGEASILINKGEINEKELKKLRISINELSEQLRIKGFATISDIDYAVLETNGDLSIIPRPEKRPLTPEDLHMIKPTEILPVTLVVDGTLFENALFSLQLNRDSFFKEMNRQKINSLGDILFCYSDERKNLCFHLKDKEGEGQ